MIGGSGSAEYTRTAREVVHKVQLGVCKAIVTGEGGEYREGEALEALKGYLDEHGTSGGLARRRHDIFRMVNGVRCLGNKWPTIQPGETEPEQGEEPESEATAPGRTPSTSSV